jgi:glycosyltransferase involved in cell wall biosynthesis
MGGSSRLRAAFFSACFFHQGDCLMKSLGPFRVALLGPANTVHLQRWAHALAGRGHEMCIISQHRCDTALLPRNARVVWLPYQGQTGYFTNAWALRRELRAWRPSVLNAHYASGYGTTAALAGYRPTLLSVWGSDVYDFPYEGALKRRLLKRNLRSATAIASTSHAMAQQVRRLTPERLEVAITPFGVDLEAFVAAPYSRCPGSLTLGIVKTLAPKYGVDLLLRAFAGLLADPELRAKRDDYRLMVVGDGPQKRELVALSEQLGIAAVTEFVGLVPHSDVPRWLHRMDIYVAPSRLDSESFGVAIIEASACGLPVVVSDAGGLPEVVRHGVTGLVVPRNNVAALQDALKRLVIDEDLRARLGSGGRSHVAQVYEWGHCVDLMEQTYARAMELAGVPGNPLFNSSSARP